MFGAMIYSILGTFCLSMDLDVWSKKISMDQLTSFYHFACNSNSSSIQCTAYCATAEVIPKMLQVKVLPSYLADLTQIHLDSKCKCHVLHLFLYVDAIMDGSLHV